MRWRTEKIQGVTHHITSTTQGDVMLARIEQKAADQRAVWAVYLNGGDTRSYHPSLSAARQHVQKIYSPAVEA